MLSDSANVLRFIFSSDRTAGVERAQRRIEAGVRLVVRRRSLAASVANDAGNVFRADNVALIANAIEPVTTHLLNTVLTLGFGQRH